MNETQKSVISIVEIGLHLVKNKDEICEIICNFRRQDCSGNEFFSNQCPMLLDNGDCIKYATRDGK